MGFAQKPAWHHSPPWVVAQQPVPPQLNPPGLARSGVKIARMPIQPGVTPTGADSSAAAAAAAASAGAFNVSSYLSSLNLPPGMWWG